LFGDALNNADEPEQQPVLRLPMPRPEAPIDPDDGPLQQFAHDLRCLRRSAGNPGYRELAARTNYAVSTLSSAASGRRKPTLDVTRAFVMACGGDVEDWTARWHSLAQPAGPADLARSADPAAQASALSQPRRAYRRRAVLAAVGTCTLVVGLLVAWWAGQGTPAIPPASSDIYGCVGSDKPAALQLDTPVDLILAGWLPSHPAPWNAPQCADQIWWTPFTNGGANPSTQFVWIFHTGMTQPKTCALWTYFPPPPSGHAHGLAHYVVEDGAGSSARLVGRLTLDQMAHKGSWNSLGEYHFSDEKITITMDNQGVDNTPNHGVIAGPVHVKCATPRSS
jgi:hypothetical protein